MPDPDFMAELLELMPHELLAQPGFLTGTGGFVESGEVLVIPCQIEGESKMVRDNQTGREVVATHIVYTGEFNSLTVDGFRYTLPSEFPEPRIDLRALRVDPVSDEDGPLYEVVSFP